MVELAPVAPPSRGRIIANAVGSQVGWFACVGGAASGRPAAGTALALLLLAVHTALTPRPLNELRLLVTAGVIGMAWDSALAAAGVVQYSVGVLLPGTAPYWIGVLWALFAAMLNHSLRWLRGRPVLAAVFGALGGPLSFWAGQRMGAAAFPNFPLALAVLSVSWAVLMPGLVFLAQWMDEKLRG